MPLKPLSRTWPANRAVLLVHGVGDARPGDYVKVTGHLQAALGAAARDVAVYGLHYNAINNWLKEKTALAEKLQQARAIIRLGVGDPELAHAVAEYVGDVLWPLFSRSARAAVREAYLAQLKQLVLDGIDSGVLRANQRISIVGHSLGCFYTYEILHLAATRVSHRLMPRSHAVRFENVILMASPLQLIRTVGEGMGRAIPGGGELAAFAPGGLLLPAQAHNSGKTPSVTNWISITGELDPVGGYFFRRRASWAYMQLEGQLSIVDSQASLGIDSKAELIARLLAGVFARARPDISLDNPHSWEGYVLRHGPQLARWLTA